jgi:glycine cleavage system H protein
MMKFTESHEWVRLEKETGVIGITKQAQEELGEIVHIELPRVGKLVKAGEEVAVLESTKAAADIYAPVTGEILEVNQRLLETPQIVNQSPEIEGWLFKIKVVNLKELEKLLDRDQYLALMNT